MKPNDIDIDKLLSQFFKSAPEDEMNAACDRVLRKIHEARAIRDAGAKPVALPELAPVDQLVLTAAYLLRGEGNSVSINDKVNDLSPTEILLGTIYLSLDRMEDGGLVLSWYPEPSPDDSEPMRCFKVTETGERALAQVRATSSLLADALGDFA